MRKRDKLGLAVAATLATILPALAGCQTDQTAASVGVGASAGVGIHDTAEPAGYREPYYQPYTPGSGDWATDPANTWSAYRDANRSGQSSRPIIPAPQPAQ